MALDDLLCILAESGSQEAPNLAKIIGQIIHDSINYCYNVTFEIFDVTTLNSLFHSSDLIAYRY